MGINLGNIVTLGGKQIGSGIASNFDSASLIEDLAEIKRQPAVTLEDNIKTNDKKVEAFGSLRTILDNLKSAANFLRKPVGIGSTSSNAFEFRKVALASSTATAASTFLNISASPGASLGNYAVTVTQLAKALNKQTQSFTSQTDGSITEAAGGTTSGKFSAGTFKITGTLNTAIGDKLAASDYTVSGSGTGILTVAGIHNIQDADSDADKKLQGTISTWSATVSGNNVIINATANGNVYTATVAANTGGSSDSIAAGVITLTNSSTGTSFDINLASPYVIAGSQTNADNFAAALTSAVSSQSIYQSRTVGNFEEPSSGELDGLLRSHTEFYSNAFSTTDGTHGSFGKFDVTAVTSTGAANGTITVTINGETYEATGLGSAANDTHTANITLESTTTDKKLNLKINSAAVTLDFSSSTTAQEIEDALNEAFNVVQEDVTIGQGDSLIDIAAAINAKTTETGVAASITKISDSEYKLNLKSNNEGLANAYSLVDSNGVLAQVTLSTIQSAQNSTITVDGTSIERSTNTINDVITGLTFSLLQLTSGATVTASVTRDTTTASTAIQNFVNAYNEFRIFLAQQTERDSATSEYKETAILQNDETLTTIANKLSNEIAKAVSGVSDEDFSKLSDVGVNLDDFAGDDETPPVSNILTYDTTILEEALANNFDKVRKIFEFEFNSSSSSLTVFSRTNNPSLTSFQVDIDTGRATGQKVKILNSSGSFLFYADDPDGNKISGAEGTDLEGLTMLYTGDGTDVITVTMTQGIGDKWYNIADDSVEDDGLIDSATDFYDEEETRINDEILKIDAQVDAFRQRLVDQFRAMEEAISRINILLDFITAQNASVFKD